MGGEIRVGPVQYWSETDSIFYSSDIKKPKIQSFRTLEEKMIGGVRIHSGFFSSRCYPPTGGRSWVGGSGPGLPAPPLRGGVSGPPWVGPGRIPPPFRGLEKPRIHVLEGEKKDPGGTLKESLVFRV